MAKKGLFIIVFLLFLPPVLSLENVTNATLTGEETLYTGTVEDGQKISVDIFEFEFKVASEGGVVIDYDGSRLIVMKNDCKYQDNLRICVGDITFAYRNLTLWKDIYEAVVEIGVVKGELTLTRTIEKTKLLIGETSKVEVSMENTGGREIQNVVYKDSYPSSIGITNVEGCSLTNNSVGWEGNIISSIKEKCSYTLTGLEADEYASKAEASFFDGVSVQNAYSDEVEIEVQNYSLKVQSYLDKNKFEIGELINISFALENINDDQTITVRSFKLDIPTNLKIKKRIGLNQNEQILFWRGDLESNEKKNLTVNLQAIRTGNVPIYIEKEYKVGEFIRKFKEPFNIGIYSYSLLVNYEVSDEIISGKEINFKVSFSNPSKKNKFNDIKIDVLSNIPFADQISNFYSSLDEGKSITLYDYKIKVPEQGYYYNVTIRCKSDYGQYFKTSKNILIKEGVFEETEETINEAGLINETTEAKIGEEGIETETSAENVTEGIETTFFDIDIKRPPLMFVSTILVLLLIIGIIIGAIEIKERKKKSKHPDLEFALFTFLSMIFAVSFFFLISTAPITGFTFYEPNIEYVKDNLSLLGAMVVLLVFLFLVIYRKEPIYNPKP